MKKVNKKIKSQDRILRTVLFFVLYFIYSQVFTSLFGSSILVNFIADLVFLVAIVFAYRDNLKEDAKDLKKNYTVGKIIKTILCWVAIIFVFNMVMGMLTDLIAPNAALDDNTEAIDNLFKISSIYTIFKTMIFAIVAEELLYREAVHDVIKNKWFFILASSIIYTLLNFAWTGFKGETVWIDVFVNFLPAILFSYAYYKNDSNILVLMLIKFTYQLIPLTLMFLG